MINDKTINIIKHITEEGGTPYIVGGYVRDMVMKLSCKDIDIEVFGITAEHLKSILLKHHNNVDAVGEAFGIFKADMRSVGGDELDFSLPRRESKTGKGHKGFMVEHDPSITPVEAASRRDFTINSMFYEPISETIFDYFGAYSDIHNRILRHTSEAFSEDPLRVMRGMQFASRFGMKMHKDTAFLCATILDEFGSLAKERILSEWLKWAEKSKYPSMGLDVLYNTLWFQVFPELSDLIGCEQEPAHHPEGDAWEHTKQVVDAMCQITDREGITGRDKVILMFSALLHDTGKPSTTEYNTEKGIISSYGHDEAGAITAESFLKSIMADNNLIENVVPLVRCHMRHVLNKTVNKRIVRRLSLRVAPSTIKMLGWVVEADHSGRGTMPKGMPEAMKQVLAVSEELSITDNAIKPLLMGRHLIEFGLTPSPEFGSILDVVFEAQIEGAFDTLEGAKEWYKENIK